jgi:hypothetical protein
MVDTGKQTVEQKKLDKEGDRMKKESTPGSASSYRLVVIMLVILGVLALSLIFMPLIVPSSSGSKDLMDYYKWALSVLLGAFGAWIGAGAAYFFGKENLLESSRSTESAMRIQQESFRRSPVIERIKDMTLTAMNPNFIFDFGKTKKAVTHQLAKLKGYWFVPVVEEETGIVQDIIHAQVFWLSTFDDALTIKEIVSKMDEDKELRKLHGDLFYVKVSSDDRISDAYNLMCQKDAEVAIVVDEKGKPSHCLSKTDLRTFLKATESK